MPDDVQSERIGCDGFPLSSFRFSLCITKKEDSRIGEPSYARTLFMSRISAQHPRRNGKSIQYPLNGTVLVTITFVGLLCEVVLVVGRLFALRHMCKSVADRRVPCPLHVRLGGF